MSLLIDLIVIAAFAICFISGIKKGFVKSVIGIVIVIAAILGSTKLSPPLAKKMDDKYINPSVVKVAENAVESLLSDDVDINRLVNEMPSAFKKVLDRFDVQPEEITALFENNDQGKTDEEKVDVIAHKIGDPLSRGISKAVAFIAVFAALYLALFVISLIVCAFVKLPVLKAADKLLGGLLGVASGLLVAWGLSVAISALMPHLSVLYNGTVPETVIENSIVVKFLGSIDPFNIIK